MSKRGKINGWTCDKCGEHTYVIHVDDGVTPFYLACRASGDPDACDGMGKSMFYPAAAPPPHVLAAVRWEWYMPDRAEQRGIVDPAVLEHVSKGGLLIRELTDAGRAALKEFHSAATEGRER